MMSALSMMKATELPAGKEGNIVIKLPLPPGNLVTLWRNDERFVKSYMTKFPGYYETSDGGYIDEDGYVYVMGRMDDVINVAGHRLSTGAMEEIISNHPDVAECAVFGTHDQLKGQLPVGLFVVKAGCHPAQRRNQERTGQDGARCHRADRLFPGCDPGRQASQDPVRQDTARDHAGHRRRQGLQYAFDHR